MLQAGGGRRHHAGVDLADGALRGLEGAGVRLHSSDGAPDLTFDHALNTPLVPFAFAGEAPVS